MRALQITRVDDDMQANQFSLPVDELPREWYNIQADLPEPLPMPREPDDGVSRMDFLNRTMIHDCLKQEFSTERWTPIPEEVLDLYVQVGRPRPLYRALKLERHLQLSRTRIYYKREDLSPTGSH